jgi:hypothetical protein
MGRKPFPFTEEHLSMMGKVPDVRVAEIAGCAPLTVAKHRAAQGIPCAPPEARNAPRRRGHRVPYARFLGVAADTDIADAFSVSRQAVGFARKSRDLASPATTYPLAAAVFALVDGAEVGKTRVVVPKGLYDALVAAVTPEKETT